MSVGSRHVAVVGLAMILLLAGMFVPSRGLALACGGAALVCMLLAVFIVQFGSSKPLNSLEAWLKKTSSAEKFSPVPEYLGHDFAPLAALMEDALKECKTLREECGQERERAEKAEQELARTKTSLTAIQDQARQDEELRQAVADKTQTLFSLYWSLVHPLAKLVGHIAEGVEEQRFRLDETSKAMSHITDNVENIANSANTASEQAQGSRGVAISGAQELKVAVDSIDEVKERTLTLKDAINGLGQKAEAIGQVVGFINDVADQTNLLALNAAIEAARAGEAGRGFAVVADEVRNLAEKTMQATKEVTDAVSSIQRQTKETIEAVDSAAEQTVQSAERATSAGTSMESIVGNMEQAAQQLENIAQATVEQSRSSQDTNESLAVIRGVAQETSSHMENFTATLVKLTGSLEDLGMVAIALKNGDYNLTLSEDLVQWTDNLATGIPLIDEQHKMLLNYINNLYRATQRGVTDDVLLNILDVLHDYTVSHFSTEEQFFLHSDYPDSQKHKELHRKFTNKIAEFRDSLAKGSAQVSMELLNFLKDWLIHHIQGTDHLYVDYVQRALREEKKMSSK
ncbi:MAG TPA: bacteriohemerythrin [Candidatus Mailhella merdavium]|nr:bacteriohemerythrin [Candidatus Mailhella merdavium]